MAMLPVLRSSFAPGSFFPSPIRSDSLFDRVFGGSLLDRVFGEEGGFLGQGWSTLPLAMWEDDDNLYIEVEMPGVSENDVEVTFHNGSLFIRGERRPEEGRRYLYSGLAFGRFERAVTLPEAINTDAMEATLTNGMLRVTLPKNPEAKPKKITLKPSGTV